MNFFHLSFLLCCLEAIAIYSGHEKIQISDNHVREQVKNSEHDYHIDIPTASGLVNLKMKKSLAFDPNMPILMGEDMIIHESSGNFIVLQDVDNEASLILTKKSDSKSHSIEGYFRQGNISFNIAPQSEDGEHFVKIAAEYPNTLDVNIPQERSKRGVSKERYTVEMFFLLDNTVWEYYQSVSPSITDTAVTNLIKYQYALMANQLDLVYRRFRHPSYTISTYVKRFQIMTTAADSPFTSSAAVNHGTNNGRPAVKIDEVNKILASWLANTKNTGDLNFIDLDMTMLWTKKDVWNSRSGYGLAGQSPMAAVCTPRGYVVNEDNGVESWRIAAHELGHNLGSKHDGPYGNKACPDTNKNIMAPSLGNYAENQIQKSFQFSTCSVQQIYETLVGKTPNGFPRACLTNLASGHGILGAGNMIKKGNMVGNKFDLNQQCKNNYGADASYNPACQRTDICFRLSCAKPSGGTTTCKAETPGAEDGTSCGTGKICLSGQCVNANNINYIPAMPIQSSNINKNTNGLTDAALRMTMNGVLYTSCSNLISAFPHLCAHAFVKPKCQLSCGKLGFGINNPIKESDSCDPNPCKNSAACVNFGTGGYLCECNKGFTGKQCQSKG